MLATKWQTVKEKTNNTNQKTCLCLKRDSTKRNRLKTINKHDMNRKVKVKVAQQCLTLCNPTGCIYSPWDSPGQNAKVGGSLSLPQGIFPTQG